MDKDIFKKLYEQFIENLKLGIHEDPTNWLKESVFEEATNPATL